MRRRRGGMTLNAEINVVSLIDVMMLLMVIFMITAPMMTGGVDVSLPTAETKALEPKSGLTVSVTKAGQIFVDETPMSFEQFRGAFKALADKKPGGVFLRADAGAPYGSVVRVLAAMRASGVSDVGLVAEPEGGS
jgi:biopolymer transport protein TolR